MNKRDEWLADTLQKIGLGFFLGAFFRANTLLSGSAFVIGGIVALSVAYWLTTRTE